MQQADYLLAVKNNQKKLKSEMETQIEKQGIKDQIESSENYYKTTNQAHGREEVRTCMILRNVEKFKDSESWKGLKQFGVVRSTRIIDGKETRAERFYITSKEMSAKEMLEATRKHWEVENNLHWVLDIAFYEDASQTKNENGSENFAILRRIALNILKQDKSSKRSMKGKRKKAGWSSKYLTDLLRNHIFSTGA